MINVLPIIERINVLLNEDTEQSVTYAALEARLALEKVCYDRLRQSHDYISQDQLRRWQPGGIINSLLMEVDKHATTTRTLKISPNPAGEGKETEEEDFIEIGTQVGFKPQRIVKMWNALAKLALHARLPQHKNDHIPEYGDKQKIRTKVEEVLKELKRLSKGTMTFSGIGSEVLFECSCGEKNRRRAGLLKHNQFVHCINPKCKKTWKALKEGDGFEFEAVTHSVDCVECGASNLIPWRFFFDMKYDQMGTFTCHTCEKKNYVRWVLAQGQPNGTESAAAGPS